jgi:hypothetical protein
MMREVLPTFSSNVLPSPTNRLTPRPLSLSEEFRHTKPAARGHIPEDRCGYLKSCKFTLPCSPSTRTAASPGMAHDVTTTDGRSTILALLSCDVTSKEVIIKYLVTNRVHFSSIPSSASNLHVKTQSNVSLIFLEIRASVPVTVQNHS